MKCVHITVAYVNELPEKIKRKVGGEKGRGIEK
jgi:hypothetical protein